MKNLKYSLSLTLVLLCAPGLFAQSSAPPADAKTQWKLALKNEQIAYADFIHSASIDEQNGAFPQKMTALVDATTAVVQAKIDLASQPGAAYRDAFSKTVVLCQRSAVFYWQKTSADDRSKSGHFSEPLSDEVVTCKKELSQAE